MKIKFQQLTTYIEALLPHEIHLLVNLADKKDELNYALIQKIEGYVLKKHPLNFDAAIDKRRYANLKKWMQNRLLEHNADYKYEYLLHIEELIYTDSISVDEERWIFSAISHNKYNTFNFIKWHETIEKFMQYLLIRLRYDDYNKVEHFIRTHQKRYNKCVSTRNKISAASIDIVHHYMGKLKNSNQWEVFLIDVIYDVEVEGYLRYMALVRLTFMYSNYNNFKNLLEHYTYFDKLFSTQQLLFSKRFLLNFYANRSLILIRNKAYKQAEYYARLSVKIPLNDQLLYLNNLSSILLKQHRITEALQLMNGALPIMHKTHNYHNKFSFISFFVKCLIAEKEYKKAAQFAESILAVYGKEIIRYRWHLFFTVYVESLFMQQKWQQVLTIIKKYKLLILDKQQKMRAGYLPWIPIYYFTAAYMEGNLSKEKFTAEYHTWRKVYKKQNKLHDLFDQVDELI